MINGAHVVIHSKDAEADRAFLRDVLGFRHVDAGHGWLIFALPPAEAALHPAETGGAHTLYLMCDDLDAEMDRLSAQGVAFGPVQEPRWGKLTEIVLPSGAKLGLYEPRHPKP